MGGIKARGANLMRRKLTGIKPKDLIKTHKIIVGDFVQVVSGKKDIGKQGIVMSIIKDRNLIVVRDVAMAVKHLKPNPFYPKGDKILKETPIHYSNVQLVDPAINKPVTVVIKKIFDPQIQGLKSIRVAKDTNNHIPFPPPKDPFKDRPEGPLDTTPDLVEQVTFTPNIFKCPFPNSLMNELERMERKGGKAARAI